MKESNNNLVAISSDQHTDQRTTLFGFIDIRDRSLIPLQIILGILAVLEVIDGISDLFIQESTQKAHAYAHLGSYTLAYAAALFTIAFRPARARGLLVVITVAACGFVATSIIDILRGRADLAGETSHLTKLVAPIIVWIIATRVVHYARSPRPSLTNNTKGTDNHSS